MVVFYLCRFFSTASALGDVAPASLGEQLGVLASGLHFIWQASDQMGVAEAHTEGIGNWSKSSTSLGHHVGGE